MPPKYKELSFYLYMDLKSQDDIVSKAQQEEDEFELLRDIMMLIPSENIDKVQLKAPPPILKKPLK